MLGAAAHRRLSACRALYRMHELPALCGRLCVWQQLQLRIVLRASCEGASAVAAQGVEQQRYAICIKHNIHVQSNVSNAPHSFFVLNEK